MLYAPRNWATGALCLLLSLSSQAAELTGWTQHPSDYPVTQGMQRFAELIKEKTAGKYSGKVVDSGKLGNQDAAIALLNKGEIGFAVLNNTPLSKAVKAMEVLSLPFIFHNSRHMLSVMDGEVGHEMEVALAAQGIMVVGWYDGGARSFYASNKPLRFATDFKGLRFRVANNPLFIDMVRALEATPVVVPYKEVGQAFSAGRIDGAENNIPSYESEGHAKYARHYTFTNHVVLPEALVISPVLWKKLSAAEQAQFRAAGQESARHMRALWQLEQAANRARLEKEGVKFHELSDYGPFLTRMRALYQPYMSNPETGALVSRIILARDR